MELLLPEVALFFSAFLDTALVGLPTGPVVALSSYARPERSWVFLVIAALGSGLGTLVPYFIGRLAGDWARKRWPHLRTVMIRAFRVVRRHPWRSSLAVRWAYGLRLTLPIACGAARVPLPVYAIGSAISAVTWSAIFTLLGWGFGEATLRVLGHVRRYENYLVAAIIIALAIVFWVMRQRHVEDEVVSVLASGDAERDAAGEA